MLPEDSLHAARCKGCGITSFPARCLCPGCRASDFEALPLVGLLGEVLTWTTVQSLPPGLMQRPLQLAVVALENGVRALGQLQSNHPSIGARVRTTSGVVRTLGTDPVEGLIFIETA